MTATGLPLGLATEGSFGPDPELGIVPVHRELAVLVDDLHGHVVCEWINSHETNFANRVVGDASELDDAQLARRDFPNHALIVRSASGDAFFPGGTIHKALRD